MVFIVASLALIVFLVLWFSRKREGECESGGGVPLAKDGEGNRGAGGVD
jgi:hypothetical protein